MRNQLWLAVALLGALMGVLFIGPVGAEAKKEKVTGIIKEFDLKAKSLTIKTKDGKDLIFVIESEKALAKLDARLFPGDEVKIRYLVKDGKNVIQDTNDLKGTKPGC